EGFWIVLGQAMVVLASLVGVRILTGLLQPAAYGELALGMTIATLANEILFGPLGNGVTRFYAPAAEKGQLRAYLDGSRGLVWQASAAMALLMCVAGAGLWVAGRAQWLPLCVAGFVFAVLTGCDSVLNGIQNAARQRSIVALHQGMAAWLRCLLAFGLILWLGAGSAVAMAAYALATVVVLVSQLLFFRRVARGRTAAAGDAHAWRDRILKYSWPFASWGIFTWAQPASARWALGLFRPMGDSGVYAALFQMGAAPIAMLTAMSVQLLAPIYYQRAGDASDPLRNADVSRINLKLTGAALGVTALGFLAALFLHTYIFGFFVAKGYQSGSYLLPWVILAAGLFACGQVISLNLMSQMKTQTMVLARIVTAILGVAFNFIGAYWYGIEGVVAANILFSLLYFLWMLAFLRDDGPR
ncbi:MAG TPA: lipopolysaccharide biosynthesis protein, partial [bacterium]|nr:lipopolysaccharide biosynthesis protein [bacterium]